jgi:hypothetical protein
MVAHRFHVGDLVAANAMGVLPGPYRVTRLLPASHSGDINYRAEDLSSGQERVLAERSMKLWTERESEVQKPSSSRPY